MIKKLLFSVVSIGMMFGSVKAQSGTCASPINISCGTPYSGTTADGVSTFNTYGCSPSTPEYGKEKVHVFTLTQQSTVNISLTGLSGDLDIHLLSSCDATNGCIARHDNTISNQTLNAGTYYVIVDGYGQTSPYSGPYTLNVTCQTAGGSTLGTCGNPIAIQCGSPYNGTTADGETNFNVYSSCGTQNEYGKEKVHTFTLTQQSNVTIALSNLNGVDLDVHLLSACNTSSCIARNDNTITNQTLNAGTYYVIVDGYGTNTSLSGSYTLSLSCTSVGGTDPDLTIDTNNISVSPSQAYPNNTVNVSFTVKNIGNATASNFNVSFWLSTNTTHSTFFDDSITSETITSLAAGASQVINKTLTIPQGASVDTNYILAVADVEEIITESNEGNNIAYGIVEILQLPLSCAGAVNLNCGVPYNGNTSFGNSNVNEYTSCISWNEAGKEIVHTITTTTQGDIEATLTNLGTGIDLDVFILDACNESSCVTYGNNTATLTNAAPGLYYIVVDGYDGDEGTYTLTVNCGATSNPTNADLTIQNWYTDQSSYAANSSMQVTTTVANIGTSDVNSSFDIGFYLSIDGALDATDQLIGNKTITSLAQGASVADITSVTIPAIPTGQYYLIWKVDDRDEVSETNENNNSIFNKLISVTPATGIQEFANENVSIYPNPSNGVLNIKSNEKIETVIIYDFSGKLVHSEVINSNFKAMDLSLLENGMYSILMKLENGKFATKTLTINN